MHTQTWDKTWGKIEWGRFDEFVSKNVSELIEKGADVNMKNNEGHTPLMWAACNRNAGTVKKLIKAGADVNAQDNLGKTALMYAVMAGDEMSVGALLENGAFVNAKDFIGYSAAMYAAEKNHTEVFKMLFAHKIDLQAENTFGGNVWHTSHPGSEIRRIINHSVALSFLGKAKVKTR